MLKPLALLALVLVAAGALFLVAGQGSFFEVASRTSVAAPPARVWAVLARVRDWPHWWPGLERVELDDHLAAGGRLQLVLKGNPERSAAQLLRVAPQQELAWQRPGVLGSSTVTRFDLAATAAATEVTMTHRIRGPQALMARVTGRDRFAAYQQQLLAALSAAVLREAGTGAASEPQP